MQSSVVNILFLDHEVETLKAFDMVRVYRNKRMKFWIPTTSNIGRLRCSKDREIIDESASLRGDLLSYEWDKATCVANLFVDKGLRAMIDRIRRQGMEFVVVGQEKRINSEFIAFVDAQNNRDLPDCFIKIPWFSTKEDLDLYLDKQGVFDFALDDKSKYQKTSLVGEGTPVYKEISNGNLIYKDTTHLDHYEVFDKTGKHLGEMSRDGVLDRNKRDPKKRINLS